MKHKHAEFIKAWADDPDSVQVLYPERKIWRAFFSGSQFDMADVEFRHTPKPEYWYLGVVGKSLCGDLQLNNPTKQRCGNDGIRLTIVDGKCTAAELITKGDGK